MGRKTVNSIIKRITIPVSMFISDSHFEKWVRRMTSNKYKPRCKPQGHYCRVCGELKANEKFSGKGHAAHICKNCASLPHAERLEKQTLRRIESMAFRHLSESEIKWLRGKMKDKRQDVSKAAREIHGVRFPRYERNRIKKGLTAFSLEFFIRGEVWDEWGDKAPCICVLL